MIEPVTSYEINGYTAKNFRRMDHGQVVETWCEFWKDDEKVFTVYRMLSNSEARLCIEVHENSYRLGHTAGMLTRVRQGIDNLKVKVDLLKACESMLPLLEHAEACEASADDGLGDRLRSLRRQLNAARAAIKQAKGD